MFKLLIWLLRIIYTLFCAMSLLIGVVLVAHMTFPITPDSIIQLIGGLFILAFGFVMLYFVIDTWRYDK
jgi:membrane protein YdbS with pleckstrin-like domain